MIFAAFDLQVTLMLPSKFQVNCHFRSGKEGKNRFSWQPWQLSWNSDQKDFSYFLSISHPDASYQVSSQLAFLFRRRGELELVFVKHSAPNCLTLTLLDSNTA